MPGKGWLLDTCVISESTRKRPDAGVLQWLAERDEQQLYLSALSVGEIAKGVAKLGEHPRAAVLDRWLRQDLPQRFAGRLLPFDSACILRWGALCGQAERVGKPLAAIDSQLAATALEHGLVLVTRNTDDFLRTGVELFNPWLQGRRGAP